MRFVTFSKVIKVEERFRKRYIKGVGDKAEFETESLGFFLWMKGSHEAMHLGFEDPGFNVGNKLKITIEKVQNGDS